MKAIRIAAALLLVLAAAACGAQGPTGPETPRGGQSPTTVQATVPGAPSFGGGYIGSGT